MIGKNVWLLFVVSLIFSSGSMANDLVLTESANKQGSVYDVDFVANKNPNVVAMDYEIYIGKHAGRVDVSNCVGGLPATHQGQCVYKEDQGIVRVILFSLSLDPLATGNIGSVLIRGLEKIGDSVEIRNVHMSDASGSGVEYELLVNK